MKNDQSKDDPKPEPQVPEVRVAVFGMSGAGKTALLASFYNAQTLPACEEQNGYRLQANDPSHIGKLVDYLYKLNDGTFGAGSTEFDEYLFDFIPRELDSAGMRVRWYDYPGSWLHQRAANPAEQKKRLEHLGKLADSQVGLLLLDGARYQTEGVLYLKAELKKFADTCRHLRTELGSARDRQPTSFPREWIVALSKADVLDPPMSAGDFHDLLAGEAAEELFNLALVVGHSAAVGNRCMVLSSAKVEGNRVDSSVSQGLTLLAPALLISSIEAAAKAAHDKLEDSEDTTQLGIWQFVKRYVSLAPKLARLLPKPYNLFVPAILEKLDLESLAKRKVEALVSARDRSIKKRDGLSAVVNSMAALLLGDEAKRNYFRKAIAQWR